MFGSGDSDNTTRGCGENKPTTDTDIHTFFSLQFSNIQQMKPLEMTWEGNRHVMLDDILLLRD